MRRLFTLLLMLGLTRAAFGQGNQPNPVIPVPDFERFNEVFTSNRSTCYLVPVGAAYWQIKWSVVGTVSGGTIKLVGADNPACSSSSDIIAAAAATVGGIADITEGPYRYVGLTFASYAGTGSVYVWLGGYKANPTAPTAVTGAVTITDGVDTAAVTAGNDLQVSCSNCTGTGASKADDAAFGIATDSVAPAGALFDDVAPDSVNEGDVGLLRMSANRNLFATLRDAAGNERGVNVTAANELTVSNTTAIVAGNNNIGDVDIASFPDNEPINVAQINGVTVLMGNGASGTGAQRVTIANDSTGILAAVTSITNPVTVTDGAGALNMICDSGCSGGAQYTDGAVAAANPVGNALIYVRADTPASIEANGDNIAARGNAYGAQYVTLLNQSGTYALPTDSADNAALSAAPVLTGGAYIVAPSDHTDGDAAQFLTDIKGRLIAVGLGTAGTAAGGVLTVQGVASMTPILATVTATNLDVQIGGSDSLTIGTFPDNEPFNIAQMNGVTVLMGNGASGTGAQRVTIASDSTGVVGLNAGTNLIGKVDIQSAGTAIPLVTDPCDGNVKSYFPIDIVTATTTEVVNASASDKFYLCSINIGPINAANNVTLVEDDTDACASPTAGIFGGVTAAEGWNIAANGGLTLGNGGSMVAVSANVNRYICLITSAASQLSGGISYVLAP